MSWLQGIKLSTRLVASFVVIGAITALLGAFALNQLLSVYESAREVQLRRLPSSQTLSMIDGQLAKFRMAELQHVLSTTTGQRRWYEIEMGNLRSALQHNQTVYEPLIDTPTERALYRKFNANWASYLDQKRPPLPSPTPEGRTRPRRSCEGLRRSSSLARAKRCRSSASSRCRQASTRPRAVRRTMSPRETS